MARLRKAIRTRLSTDPVNAQIRLSSTPPSHQRLEALILAGGKGKRLRSVVQDRPKPMAEVDGLPFVERLLLALRAQGIRRVIFCAGYKSKMIENYFRGGERWDMQVTYSLEPIPLGTAGAVRNALSQVRSDRFLVMNGDSYCRMDFNLLEQVHTEHAASATLWLVRTENCSGYGSVEIGRDGTVQAFHEKPPQKHAGLINAGAYLLEREAAMTIPNGRAASLETEFFPQMIGHGLHAVIGDGPFLDIGSPEGYAAADAFFAEGLLA